MNRILSCSLAGLFMGGWLLCQVPGPVPGPVPQEVVAPIPERTPEPETKPAEVHTGCVSGEAVAKGAKKAGCGKTVPEPKKDESVVATRERPIRVSFGEPNVWSLDQAHYLLEQRFQRNQTLEATRPGSDELNANAVNGNRFSAVRQLVQGGVGFDQNTGVTNEMARQRMQEDLALRPERRRQLDESLRRQAELGAKMQLIADDPASYTPPKTDGTKELTAEAKAKNAALAAQMEAEKRVGETYKTALTDSVPTSFTKSDLQADKVNLSGVTMDLFKDKLAFGDPKLAASNAVDNYVNLQNEMIMKQVTLLRNEAGLNRRVVFAEIPQDFTVDGSRWYAKRAENKLVRVEWKLKGYMYIPLSAKREAEEGKWRRVPRPDGEGCLIDNDMHAGNPMNSANNVLLKGFLRKWIVECTSALSCNFLSRRKQIGALKSFYRGNPEDDTDDDKEALDAIQWLDCNAKYAEVIAEGAKPLDIPAGGTSMMPLGTLRTIDLVPRQSSLNVNDRHYASNSLNLSGMFRLLSGLGANVNYQRQKETYEQYINQDVFATSFGKGTSEFGWTFGPNPGTKTLSPGQRTTYAVFSVPANALAVVLEAKACVYDRRDRFNRGTDCEPEKQFSVPIPGEFESGFWLDEVRYVPVPAGSRTIVHLKGRHFSSLTGVVVNGTPLRRAVGLAAPYMPVSAPGGSSEVDGEYEMLGSDKIVLSFRMASSFSGTPVISLVTPVKARFINDLELSHLRVGAKRYKPGTPLSNAYVVPMFYPKSEIKTVRWQGGNSLVVEGTGLYRGGGDWATYFWNGKKIQPAAVDSGGDFFGERVVLEVDPSNDRGPNSELRLDFGSDLGMAALRYTVSNPRVLTISKATVVKFVAFKEKEEKKGENSKPAVPGAALVELQGTGFAAGLTATVVLSHGSAESQLSLISDTRALVWFSILEPAASAKFAVITLTHPHSLLTTSSYVELVEPKKAEEEKETVTETSTTVKKVPTPKKP